MSDNLPKPPDGGPVEITPEQFGRALEALGLSDTEAGDFFGVGSRVVRRWVAGEDETKTPLTGIVILLALMLHLRMKPAEAMMLARAIFPQSEKRP